MATNSNRSPTLYPGSRINPRALRFDPSQLSDHWKDFVGYAAAATLTSLRGPSLESPQGSEMNPFALAASTIPRLLPSEFDLARFEHPVTGDAGRCCFSISWL